MSRLFVTKTSFTAGELDPGLLGRLDLKAQEDGAAKLRNVLVQATGGVTRRPGLARVAALPGAARLVGFEAPSGPVLVALGPTRIDVLRDGGVLASLPGLWTAAQLPDIAWARSRDRLLITHPEVAPRALVETEPDAFALVGWEFETAGDGAPAVRTLQPYARFAPTGVVLELRDPVSGDANGELGRGVVELVTSVPVFGAGHVGAVVRYRGREVTVSSPDPVRPTRAVGFLHEEVPNGRATREWDEQAFSAARGWPATVTVYQDRLVLGGSRDLPDRIWMSRTGRHLDFELTDPDPDIGVLDDHAIAFRLGADELHRIRALVPGRQLQVFTSAGEWIVRGVPLTPASVEVELQTRVGSWARRRVQPVDVDGATLFVGAGGRELREYLFAESEQAYQAADIALLARHLMRDPVDLVFDGRRRLLLIPRADGQAAAVTIDRNSNVAAWSLLGGSGRFLTAALHRGEPWFLVELGGEVLLERLDDAQGSDHARLLEHPTPTVSWSGLDELEGREVLALGEEGWLTRTVVVAGSITLPRPTRRLVVGVPFSHEVEPMPVAVQSGRGVSLDHPYRPVRTTLRVLETGALRVDAGDGPRPALPATAGPVAFTGDIAVRALGWRRGLGDPAWRVTGDDPLPATLLSVTTEIKVND